MLLPPSAAHDPLRRPRARLHLRAGGVIMVVTMTMITTAEKTPGSTTGTLPMVSVIPILAKINPTSLGQRGDRPVCRP